MSPYVLFQRSASTIGPLQQGGDQSLQSSPVPTDAYIRSDAFGLYCKPRVEQKHFEANKTSWTVDELQFLAAYFVSRGVTKIRLTGGEPLLCGDLEDLIGSLHALRSLNSPVGGLRHISMTTNGVTFSRKAADLKAAGLNSVNISLDSLRADRVRRLTGFPVLKHTISAIYAALEHEYNPVKVNCVLIRGFNDDELTDFVKMTEKLPIEVRFIEYMPFAGNQWEQKKMIPFLEMMQDVRVHYPNLEVVPAQSDSTAKVMNGDVGIGKMQANLKISLLSRWLTWESFFSILVILPLIYCLYR
ncbi:unnamed protein product [Echinostoma caproni]|uniref:Radical_SAM domain-containing protein n=1 Tax=Echinostoma caproni TaxID=27848 RepID=A0A183B423_9TREM|nr:unnamed protein product [Echinostoma caproni]